MFKALNIYYNYLYSHTSNKSRYTREIRKQSVEQRIELTSQLCFFLENGVSSKEEVLLKEILKLLAFDPNCAVRIFLSNKLQYSYHLPTDIAIKLVYDINEVSIPIITNSPKLTENDLKEVLLKAQDSNKLLALTKRYYLGKEVCAQIISKRDVTLVVSLLNNASSDISINSYKHILNTYYNHHEVLDALITRNALDRNVLQNLLVELDQTAQKIIAKKFNLTNNTNKKAFCSLETLNTTAYSSNLDLIDIRNEIDLLYKNHSLHNAILIRYLYKGELLGFIYSLSKLADTPFNQVKHIVLTQLKTEEFDQLYYATGLSTSLLLATKALVEILIEEMQKGQNINPYTLPFKITSSIKENKLDETIPHMKYILRMIG